MYHARTALPQLLPAANYFAPQTHARETAYVFERTWQCVAATNELPRPGDFITCELAGRPLIVRNEAGTFRTYLNVCAHRRCLLTSEPRGHSEKLHCQYHGWEYDADGRTARIPQAKQFAPLDRDALRLRTFRTETCGQLIFASLADDGPTLREQFGSAYELCAQRFGGERPTSMSQTREFAVNWKVPVENTLESYHVPNVHATTFKDDPGEERATHRLLSSHSEFTTQMPFSTHSRVDDLLQRFEGRFLRLLGMKPTGEYWHVHIYPNTLLSFTDGLSLCQTFVPTSPTTCRGTFRQFGLDRTGWPAWKRGAAKLWDAATATAAWRIMQEDFGLYAAVQRGLQASVQPGVLGRCEERIHAFQQWLLRATDDEPRAAPSLKPEADSSPGGVVTNPVGPTTIGCDGCDATTTREPGT